MHAQARAETPAAAEAVWAVVAAPTTWPERTDTVDVLVARDEDRPTVGARYRLRRPSTRAMTWTVTALDPGRLLRWEARVLGARTVVEYVVAADGSGSVLTATYTQDGPLAAALGALGGHHQALVLEREVSALAASAAAGPPPG
ncbi:polyketide cyclase/dehydrase/lipid transport protein [Mumia flava]|uniref:Polyketide cyclase/dehydrase/lipid transport protein n=1 Tax=Mumia flava TaxID=1348852 RepID=A0A2M9B6H8_9ACTN|nr:SRPBCC family protein [Mumia flava]PJJ53532.1 polyketide cyclase/dehydrase/lipid transport protein [Mumia flava]